VSTKILIVDDEKDIVTMLGAFFESKGFFVLSAINGALNPPNPFGQSHTSLVK
jgi:DNA-binding response OmpR family regulator